MERGAGEVGTRGEGSGDEGMGVGERGEKIEFEAIGKKGSGVGEKAGTETARQEVVNMQKRNGMNRDLDI